jgi:hypothetical protein
MGLFSKKKKELDFPSSQAQPDPGIPDLNQLLSEAPVPPPELQQLNLPFPKDMGGMQFPMPPGMQSPFPEPPGLHIPPPPGTAKPLPAFEGIGPAPAQQPTVRSQLSQQPADNMGESFELPDFDEEDLKDIEEAERAPPKVDAEEEKAEMPSYAAVEEGTEPAGREDDDLKYPEPAMPRMPAGKDKYMEINHCFEAKETVEALRKTAKTTEDSIENHSAKETNEKYHSLLNTLNIMQEKMMMIDNKLFE